MVQAFIADSRLYVRGDDGQVREIESPFVRKKMEDAERHEANRAWKSAPREGADPYAPMLWGKQGTTGSGAMGTDTNAAKRRDRGDRPKSLFL